MGTSRALDGSLFGIAREIKLGLWSTTIRVLKGCLRELKVAVEGQLEVHSERMLSEIFNGVAILGSQLCGFLMKMALRRCADHAEHIARLEENLNGILDDLRKVGIYSEGFVSLYDFLMSPYEVQGTANERVPLRLKWTLLPATETKEVKLQNDPRRVWSMIEETYENSNKTLKLSRHEFFKIMRKRQGEEAHKFALPSHKKTNYHCELRLHEHLTLLGIQRATIGVSEDCCGICAHAFDILNCELYRSLKLVSQFTVSSTPAWLLSGSYGGISLGLLPASDVLRDGLKKRVDGLLIQAIERLDRQSRYVHIDRDVYLKIFRDSLQYKNEK